MSRRFVLMSIICFTLSISGMQSLNENSIDLMILIENGSSEFEILKDGRMPSIFSSLIAGIEQNLLMIVHSGLLGMLTSEAKNKQNRHQHKLESLLNNIKNNWETKINLEGDWVVLNPKNYEFRKTLIELGFTKDLVDFWIQEASLVSNLESGKFKPINVYTFKKLFNENTFIRKRIFVDAHGISAYTKRQPLLAGMTRDQYFDFLHYLNPTTDFLYLLTCYGGGLNSIQFHNQEIRNSEERFNALSIKFPLVLGASIEAVTEMSKYAPADYKLFFKLINEYIKKPNSQNLKDALNVLYKKMNPETGIPLIKFPGSREFFRAVDLDKTIRLFTMVEMRSHELVLKDKKVVGQITPLELLDNQKLLVYPAILLIPIKIFGIDTAILSMIPGNATHFFDSFSSNQSFRKTLNIFSSEDVAIKVWSFKKMICNDAIFENVILIKRGEKFKLVAKVNSLKPDYKQFVNSYFKIESDFSVYKDPLSMEAWQTPFESPEESGLKSIDSQGAFDIAKTWFNLAMPNPESLRQATAGMQPLSMIENAIKASLDAMRV